MFFDGAEMFQAEALRHRGFGISVLLAFVPLCEILFLCFLAANTDASEPTILVIKSDDGKPVAVEAIGLAQSDLTSLAKLAEDDPQWAKTLEVHVRGDKSDEKPPPIAGRYEVRGTSARFTPRDRKSVV